MKRIIAMMLCIMFSLALVACNAPRYPRIHYENSDWRFDSYDVYVKVEDGYTLDYSHPYEKAETNNGYDLTFHFVEVK